MKPWSGSRTSSGGTSKPAPSKHGADGVRADRDAGSVSPGRQRARQSRRAAGTWHQQRFGGQSCSCTAGATTSSTWNWRISGPGSGFEFFALDMHNHGRSLRPEHPWRLRGGPGRLRRRNQRTRVGIIGRSGRPGAGAAADSDGPLHRRPDGGAVGQPPPGGRVAADPEQPVAGNARQPAGAPRRADHGGPFARFRPEAVLRLPERGFYWRTISSAAEGEWTLDDTLPAAAWLSRSAPAGSAPCSPAMPRWPAA